jgi:hypothetical protein
MQLKNRDRYEPDTDGRIYRLSYEQDDNIFINFDERELGEVAEILIRRRKKTAIKIISIIDQVGDKLGQKNLFVEEVKEKCLPKR